ncbi:MAG: hypothetical protein IAF38_20900 [Bacteroidia bacterium]|nr:hypothetical protein [Bacteroidia bacterium]
MKCIPAILLVLLLFSCTEKKAPATDSSKIIISWADSLPGDFSFKEEWEYPEGVYVNDWGQVSCDGFCPEGTDQMKDDEGKLTKDSLPAFYKLVDTTHQFHSISCDAWCYEYGGANFIKIQKEGEKNFSAYTMCNPGTHCSLEMKLAGDTCTPSISLVSIVEGGNAIFKCTGGKISVQKNLF